MTEVLSNFVRALRAADVRVSTAESIDAAAAVDAVGFADRVVLKDALSQVLAKTADDKARFSACFDAFFRFEDLTAVAGDDGQGRDADDAARVADTVAAGSGPEHGFNGAGGGDAAALLALLEAGDGAGLEVRVAAAARAVGLAEIRLFTQRGIFTRRILERIGIDALETAIAAAARQDDAAGRARLERLRLLRARLVERVRELVERQMLLYTANAGRRLREEMLRKIPLTRMEARDFKLMQELVRKLTRRLVALHSRRRKIARRGQLDVRHTIRRNVEYDGLLFERVWKKIRIDRPKIIAVCDVSRSVAAVARFLLLFLYSVTEVLPRVRAFAFSHRLAEVTALFADKPVEDAVAETLLRHGGGSTDYGRALAELAGLALDDVDHRTTVLILGDARSNYGDPGVAYLRELHGRARRVIWLNPEPRPFWNTGDSEMQKLGAACDRVEHCRSLQHLERLVSELMRSAV